MTKKIVAVLFLAIALTGCVSMNDAMLHPNGTSKTCSSSGGGLIGMAATAVNQNMCVSKLTDEGYIKLENFGWTGLHFRFENRAVSIEQVDANSPASKAGIPANAEVMLINQQIPASLEEAQKLVFGPKNAAHEIKVKLSSGPATYQLTAEAAPTNTMFSINGNTFFTREDLLTYQRNRQALQLAKLEKRSKPILAKGKVVIGNAKAIEALIPKSNPQANAKYLAEIWQVTLANAAQVIQKRGIFEQTTIIESGNLAVAPATSDEPVIYLLAPGNAVQKWQIQFPDGKVLVIQPLQTLDMPQLVADIERILEKYVAEQAKG